MGYMQLVFKELILAVLSWNPPALVQRSSRYLWKNEVISQLLSFPSEFSCFSSISVTSQELGKQFSNKNKTLLSNGQVDFNEERAGPLVAQILALQSDLEVLVTAFSTFSPWL